MTFADNMHGHAVTDIDIWDTVMNGVPLLVASGDVAGRNKDYLVIASQHPEDNGQSENGYNIIGILWKCIVKLEVMKAQR